MENTVTNDLSGLKRPGETTAYDQWLADEGIPVIGGYAIEDLNQVPLEPWKRKGGKGAMINLAGHEQSNDAYVCEIPPGGRLNPQKHLYEEAILILGGRGATTVWNEGGPKQTFEWSRWSLFSIPLNAWHQHFNGQGEEPARYFAVTGAPSMISQFHNLDFIFNNSYVFKDRFSGEENYFGGSGVLEDVSSAGKGNRKVWKTNFIPDVTSFKLYEWKEKGAQSYVALDMTGNTLGAHISEIPVASYVKAHRHGPGANVTIVDGQGYTLMWLEGQPKMKVPWRTGSLVVPPGNWFHQHFNTGRTPARQVALRWGTMKHPVGKQWRLGQSVKTGGDMIEYEDEDPEVRQMYETEIVRNGLKIQMPPIRREPAK
ncbi:MAG: hypothetical protein Q8P24_12025 [Desulfobacterales bacterium]|nr:hypothetical protein [Desulfobacterales bacterium]